MAAASGGHRAECGAGRPGAEGPARDWRRGREQPPQPLPGPCDSGCWKGWRLPRRRHARSSAIFVRQRKFAASLVRRGFARAVCVCVCVAPAPRARWRAQVNFVVCQLFALLAAIWFRTYLHASRTSSFIRHGIATLLGLYLALFCFGWYALHFLVQSGVSYCIMVIIGVERMHKYCFVFALGYLTVCQITRVYIFDYGQYSADFSGPMMIITQKITSLAYEIHDGMFRKDEELTPSQRGLAVRRMPSLLEYLSYNCNFMGILAGPLCSYKDYITFIEGRSYQMAQSGEDGKEEAQCERTEPSPNVAVVQKLVVCGLSLLFHLTVSSSLPVQYNIDEHFQAAAAWPAKVAYLYVSLLAARPKYYFAWTLADAINNAAGFGFRGYDRNGAARWDLISNLRIQQIEMSTSFKMFLDNWNIQTALWLKR
nr:lysophospholipid acyltransferase 2 isoform X7 [Oryctolagus cuniculus]